MEIVEKRDYEEKPASPLVLRSCSAVAFMHLAYQSLGEERKLKTEKVGGFRGGGSA
jgi:hypothetical protein